MKKRPAHGLPWCLILFLTEEAALLKEKIVKTEERTTPKVCLKPPQGTQFVRR